MPIDTSRLAFPKGRPASLLRADTKKQRQTVDERESDAVRKRSGGQCEVWQQVKFDVVRCRRRASHVHHMIGGIGRRGRGESAKAIRKQHVCEKCHDDIGGKKLVRWGTEMPHYSDSYRRVK